MMRAERIAEQVARLPAELRSVLERELAAGNALIEAETGTGALHQTVALILERPFHSTEAPAGVAYREIAATDRRIFEFFTADESFSLAYVKFKPMKLIELGPGPPNPTEAHIAFMQQRAKEEEARTARRAAEAHDPPAPAPKPAPGAPDTCSPADRFLASMNITYEMWHDGIGYDLEALQQVSASELKSIESVLIHHQPRDWRDIEALAHIDSPTARSAVEAGLKSSDAKVRQEAMNHAADKADPAEREKHLLRDLARSGLFDGLSEAIDEAAEFHPPAVIEALFQGALHRDNEAAVHFAALLFYIHGKAAEPFDWNHRPFFLKFATQDSKERQAAFRELCTTIGVDVNKYLPGPA